MRPLDHFDIILLAELRVGLPPLFYHKLLRIRDDWSFVLKLHAFFEGCLAQLLQEKLKRERFRQHQMTPHDSFVSRLYLADRMKLLEPDRKMFLQSLNSLRNQITHQLRFIDFDLPRYIDDLSDRDFRKLALHLCTGLENITLADCRLSKLPTKRPVRHSSKTVREHVFLHYPKFSIWFSGVMALELLSLQFHFDISDDEIIPEPDIEAKLQDLLLDPAVLEFKRTSQWPL